MNLFANATEVWTSALFVATAALALATRSLVKSGERTAQKQLRAYVSGQPDFLFSFDTETVAKAAFSILNHGQTPATDLKHRGRVAVLPYPLPPGFEFPELPEFGDSTLVVHPRSNAPFKGFAEAARPFTANEIASAIEGKSERIYVFGEIAYDDLLGKSWWTTFCFSVAGGEALRKVSQGTEESVHLDFDAASQRNEIGSASF